MDQKVNHAEYVVFGSTDMKYMASVLLDVIRLGVSVQRSTPLYNLSSTRRLLLQKERVRQ